MADSPIAFKNRDIVLLSFPRREIDAGLQSVLIKSLQDHSLCIHLYKVQNKIGKHNDLVHRVTTAVNESFQNVLPRLSSK